MAKDFNVDDIMTDEERRQMEICVDYLAQMYRKYLPVLLAEDKQDK